jgi:hypothetical protein
VRIPISGAPLVRAAVAVALASGALLGTAAAPPSAAADCAPIVSLEEAILFADTVFVGSVTQLENSGRWATVRVEERWKGARDLPDTVQVRGGPEPGTASSVDRKFMPGRYLFFVRPGLGYLEDNGCSATTSWTDDLAVLRPAGVTAGTDVVTGTQVTEFDLDPYLPIAALALALIVAVIAYLVVLRARNRPPDWMR